MATIKAIEHRSVHQIQSGQVIVDLCSVAKELVENSLDAGATSVEVRFKNYGADAIEVQDNGKGIAPEDFETVALKHYTSKISSFEDLQSLDTFGFRGEALSSLCALSKFHIVTARAEDGAVGKKLEFEVSGKLKATSVTASPKGTTVYVQDLFHNLPVRRRELEKNVKREYGKVISLLHSYACISVGVRLSVSNQIPKGKKTSVLATNSNTTVKENIANVFGAKVLTGLLELHLDLELQPSYLSGAPDQRNRTSRASYDPLAVTIEGYVSKPIFGEGRQATDRQMLFVNSRPCLLPQVSKAFNEVYKSFNVSQSPFILANLKLDTSSYDINVSPDKRSIMLHDQGTLLENIKTALVELFERTAHTIPQSHLPSQSLLSLKTQARSSEKSIDTVEGEDDSGEDHDLANTDDGQKLGLDSRATPSRLIHDWVGQRSRSRDGVNASSLGATFSNNHFRTAKAPQTVHVPSNQRDAETRRRASSRSDSLGEQADDDGISPPKNANDDNLAGNQEPLERDGPSQPPNSNRSAQLRYNARKAANEPRTHSKDFEVRDGDTLGIGSDNHRVSHSEDRSDDGDSQSSEEVEEPIPSSNPGTPKAVPGAVQSAFDRMRPTRVPVQVAEITVGDETIRTMVGNARPFKKRRIHEVKAPLVDTTPLLSRQFGMRFAAPDSEMRSGAVRHSQTSTESVTIDSPLDDDASSQEYQSEADDLSTDDEAGGTVDGHHSPEHSQEDEGDPEDEYMDNEQSKLSSEERAAGPVQEAEENTAVRSDDNIKRAAQALKNNGNRKDSTLQLSMPLQTSLEEIRKQTSDLYSDSTGRLRALNDNSQRSNTMVKDEINSAEAESRLSLTVAKSDFGRMEIVGQFNLGFILAVRRAEKADEEDDLFIIDQHAADEKYNYERLRQTVALESQRLVRPKLLELTAVEEEIVLHNSAALKANGFEVEVEAPPADDHAHDDDESTARQRYRLLTLPMSKEKTFQLSDLEELLHLIAETPAGSAHIPRPRKVETMLAMRACRSSIMVGRTLTARQMEKVVRHMGEMEKPWNCPHGRPTMRHLAVLDAWKPWQEGDVDEPADDDAGTFPSVERTVDWEAWLTERKRNVSAMGI